MSTSILYHGFGIVGYKYVRSQYEGGAIIFTINQDPSTLVCPVCENRKVIRKGTTSRRFRTLPIGGKPVFIDFAVQRIKCLVCGALQQVKVRFADAHRRFTRQFERYVIELCQKMTMLDVARHLGVSWDVVKDIEKRYLKSKFSRPRLKGLKRIAIDEITIGAGHRYLTVVLDLDSGSVVFVGDGKGAASLQPFWKRLRSSGAKVEAVAIDMSPAYISAVSSCLPKATIVFDHFHVIKYFNDKLSDFRRDLYRKTKDSSEKSVLKGTRWLLLKNPENLVSQRNEHKRLEEALNINKPLATAYYLKENLRLVWKQPDKKTAEVHLNHWIAQAESSEISMLKRFAKTLRTHRFGILAYYDYRISTAPLEGTNNKIKTIQKQAYGFRDKQFFMLKIYALHYTRYALLG